MQQTRLWHLLSAFALIAILLTACGAPATPAPTSAPAPTEAAAQPAATEAPAPTQAPSGEKTVLHIMHNWAPDDPKGPILQGVFDDFMAANPDVSIETEVFSDLDIPIKVETAFTAGEEPDIVFNNYAGSRETWIDAGVTIPVDDLMTEWGFDGKFLPVALDSAKDPQGRLVGFPLEGFTWPVWYNTRILDEAGVQIPTTIDELIDIAPKIRAAGYEPFVTGGTDWSGYAVFTTIMQLPLPDDEMKQLYAHGGFAQSENARKGIELFTRVRDSNVFATNTEGLDGTAMTTMFYAEKVAMMQAGSWSFGELPAEMADHVTLGGFPILPDSIHPTPVIYAGFGKAVWITRNGATKLDAVRRFVQFMFSPEVIARFVEEAGMPSPLIENKVDPAKLSPFMVQSTEYVKNVAVMPLTDDSVPGNLFEDLYRTTAEAFIPTTTADTIIKHLDDVYAQQ